MVTGDNNDVVAQPELDRSRATSLVFDVLTAVIPGLKAEAVDERQELYADLGVDSMCFVELLINFEGRLNVDVAEDDLMAIELVTVADLINLVERISPSAGK